MKIFKGEHFDLTILETAEELLQLCGGPDDVRKTRKEFITLLHNRRNQLAGRKYDEIWKETFSG